MNARLPMESDSTLAQASPTPPTARPPQPAKIAANDAAIPIELKRLKRWVTWNWTWSEKSGKYTKPPMQLNGMHASTIDPSTWTTYDQAKLCGMLRSGIGFVLGNEVGIVGIDLDDCRDPITGEIKQLQAEIIRQLDTYAEVSPSGTGVKLLCRATLPEKCRKADHEIGIEVYGDKRYFTITGDIIPGSPKTINPRQAVIDELIDRWMMIDKEELPRPVAASLEDEIELAKSALHAINPGRARGYWDWLTIGMALHAVSPTLCDEWDRWSSQASDKYESGMCQRKWAGFESTGFGPGTLYYFAKLDGWRPPRGWRKTKTSSSTNFPAVEEGDSRTQIPLSDNEAKMVNQVIASLKSEPNLFVRSDRLIEVYDAPNPADPQKLTTIAMRQIPPDKLRTIISGNCCFVRDDGEKISVARIPSHLPSQVFYNATYPGLRSLIGVSEWPFMRSDGSICTQNGYDPITQTIMRCSVLIPPIKDEPTKEDAWNAADSLLRIIQDFEFDHLKHKAAWLAALLTIAARPAISGPVPLFLIDASIWGSGKSKLASLIALIYSGRPMPITSWPSKDEEIDKRLASFIMEGRPWVLWDNAKTLIGGQAIEAILTSQIYIGRRLGKSETAGELPANIIQFVTGNNASVSDDVARRTCHIRIVSSSENPDSRTNFRIPDLDEHVRTNRITYLHNALTILRAWHVARYRGERVEVEAWGSFEAWARVVRDAICWLGLPDVRSTSTDLKIDTSTGDSFKELIEGLEDAGIPEEGWTSREILKAATESVAGFEKPRNELLNSVLHEIIGERKNFSAREIGKALKKFDGRIQGNKKFLTIYDAHTKINSWKVVSVA